MKTLSYIIAVALLLTGIYGFLLLIGEPLEGTRFDCITGIIVMKMAGAACMLSAIYGFKKMLS